jgi:hypothetical protein
MKLRQIAVVLAALVLLFAAGCSEDASSKAPQKTMTETQAIATRPLCVGRFLIDAPADAKVVWTSTETHAAGEIAAPISSDERGFERLMASTEAELRTQTHYEETTRFKEVIAPDQATRVFVYRGDSIDTTGFQLDGYVLKGQTVFKVRGFANNDLLARAKSRVSNGLRNILPRETWTIPTEPGFCFDGGFLPGGDGGFEATGVQLKFKAYPGLVVFMETRVRSASPVEEASLIERTDAAMKLMDTSDKPTVLRRRSDRRVAFGIAEEVLWKHHQGDYYALKGDVEMSGVNGATDKPDVAFGIVLDPLKDGTEQPEEGDVLRLLDSMVDSLRLRPGAV